MCRQILALAMLVLPLGCVRSRTAPFEADDALWSAPPLSRAVAVQDGRTGEAMSFDELLDELEDADVVFLGETHIDETTHRVELAVYDGLLQRKHGRVVLAMEMFERDVQKDLDAYLAGEIDEATFLSRSRPWSNYRTAYRPLIERARTDGRPVVASNFPRPLLRRVAMGGPEAYEALEGDERGQVPAKLLPNTDDYWRRVGNAIRSHRAMMLGGGGDDRLYNTQCLWDNSMGEACALTLDAHPGDLVLHINGGFHSEYWDGTVHQFRLRKPQARAVTVAIAPTTNPGVADVWGAPSADYVVFAEARATDLNEGTWSVYVDRELKYRLHVPKDVTADERVPLLIWLSDDGLTAEDGLALWKERLGDAAAIAVLEAPYREIQEDLSEGGRWYWPDSFASDVGTLAGGIERVWGYLMRHYPIDPARICLAGEGTGATVVAATALMTERMDVEAIAFSPRRYIKIKDFSLPLPELRGDEPPRDKSLHIVAGEDDQAWWKAELAEYTEVGLDNELTAVADDPWNAEGEIENALRAALGLEGLPDVTATERRYILADGDSPRARHWARLCALRSTENDGVPVAVLDTPPTEASAQQLAADIRPETFAEPHALPLCPGPFGGTTVVAVPADVSEQDVTAWVALEDNDPLAEMSRFYRLRVATADGERTLPEVLSTLHVEGRNNVLIVPATFCADAALMRALKKSVRELDGQMTLYWLPGLGGRNVKLVPVPTAAPEPTETPVTEDEHVEHALSVVLEPATQRLTVEDRIKLPPSLRAAGTEFTLSDALTIMESDPPVTKLESEEDEGAVRYSLQTPPTDGTLRLSYAGTMNFGLSDQKEEYTRGFRETRGIVGPEGVYLDGDSHWVPQFNDRMIHFTVEITMPDDWHVISQGNGTSRGDDGRARWDSGGLMEQVHLVGGPLIVERDVAGAVEVLVYLHERDDALARKYLDATAQYIEMYRELIGPYPYEKFALVENFWETGYGMPSFTLLGPQVIRFPFILHSSYPHEILHNWWGNSVFVEYETGNWCEGVTVYLADHLIQEQRGKGDEYRRNALQKYRDYVNEGRDFPLSEFHSRHSAATEAVGYGKSMMLFHMLRRHMGDDAFRKALAQFYREYRGQRASFDDVRTTFEQTAGEDLKPFFTQWVMRTGAPALALRNVAVREQAGAHVVTGTLEQTQEGEPFDLEVPVCVQTADSTETSIVEMRGRSAAFELTVASPPILLAVDPMFDVFRLLDPRETPPSIGQIFGEPHILAVLPASADEAETKMYQELMEKWRSDSHEIELTRDAELETLPQDRAAWILGRGNRFAATLFDANPGEPVRLGDEDVPLDGRTIVLIRRHPENTEKAIGWIALDPPAAMPGLSRKLPHYGKYSYLAFEGEEPTNVVKGQANAGNSPLVFDVREDQSGPLPAISTENRAALAELPPVFSRKDMMAHVTWLAAPEREGRGLGTPELEQSAEYIAEQMRAAGLEPGGDNGTWFQRFTVPEGPDGKPIETANVIGVLPGSRADWSQQSVVLSAHYDHLGHGWPDVRAGNEGKVHPGADDNASGVAVMLELARNLAAADGGSRNLVVIAFSAEEAERQGSRYYVEHPRFPLDQTRGVINIDTVGRLFDQELAILGTASADEWQHIFRGCGFVTGIKSRNVPESAEASDQMSFLEKGIPAVQIFTGGHADYHRPTDTIDKIDAAGLVKTAVFLKEAVTYLLEREEPLTARDAKPKQTAKMAAGGRKVTFGTVPDFGFAGPGVRIGSLVPDSPAARAGLQAGDVLLKIDDQDIKDLRAFADFLKTLEPGDQVQATIERDGERVVVPVVVEQR